MHSSTITNAQPTTSAHSIRPARSLPKWLRRIDQTEHARFIIDAWLALDPGSQDACLAQLIAATLHGGPSTALEHFAGTGELHAEDALAELNDLSVPIEREPWLDALGRYIITSGGRS